MVDINSWIIVPKFPWGIGKPNSTDNVGATSIWATVLTEFTSKLKGRQTLWNRNIAMINLIF